MNSGNTSAKTKSPELISEKILSGKFASHRYFARNTIGRDIVVGDIHGHFDVLEKALREIDFDTARDRLFALGDLVDRGPNSPAALEWLNQYWFNSVIGNHDLSHVLAAEREHISNTWVLDMIVPTRDDWAANCAPAVYSALVAEFSRLPLAISIEMSLGNVGLVHAELPHGYRTWDSFVQAIDAESIDDGALWMATSERLLDLLPVKTRADLKFFVPDVLAIFHGHTIPWLKQPVKVGNHHYIETGAYLRARTGRDGGGFTLVDIEHPNEPLLAAWWPRSSGAPDDLRTK